MKIHIDSFDASRVIPPLSDRSNEISFVCRRRHTSIFDDGNNGMRDTAIWLIIDEGNHGCGKTNKSRWLVRCEKKLIEEGHGKERVCFHM